MTNGPIELRPVRLLPFKDVDPRLAFPWDAHGHRQRLEVRGQREPPSERELASRLAAYFDGPCVEPPRRERRARVRIEMLLAVEGDAGGVALTRDDHGQSVALVWTDLKHDGRSERCDRANPGTRKTGSRCLSCVQIVHGGRRTIGCELRKVVSKRLAVFGEGPGRGEERAPILLADDLPVRPDGGYGQGRASAAALVGPIEHNGLGAAAEVKGIRVRADARHFHLVGELDELPLADERIVCRVCCAGDEAGAQKHLSDALEHRVLPDVSYPAAVIGPGPTLLVDVHFVVRRRPCRHLTTSLFGLAKLGEERPRRGSRCRRGGSRYSGSRA